MRIARLRASARSTNRSPNAPQHRPDFDVLQAHWQLAFASLDDDEQILCELRESIALLDGCVQRDADSRAGVGAPHCAFELGLDHRDRGTQFVTRVGHESRTPEYGPQR